MTSFPARLAAITTFSVIALSASHAQQRTVELGVDAGVSLLSVEGTTATIVNVPSQAFRVGFFLSDNLSLEPTVALNYANVSDVSSTNYSLNLGLLYHLSTDRSLPQIFLRPLVGYAGGRISGENNGSLSASNSSAVVGVGIGAKVPQGDRLALRFGVDYERRFEDDPLPAANRYSATVGISFFTR